MKSFTEYIKLREAGEEDTVVHDIDPDNIHELAHNIIEVKELFDQGKDELAKQKLDHLCSQIKHLDNVHDADDDLIGHKPSVGPGGEEKPPMGGLESPAVGPSGGR
jgi:hypothetical protein